MPPHVRMNFRGFSPGCGDSVADFWVWDAHEARLRCPEDVSGDMQEDEITGGALSLNLLSTQTMDTTRIFPARKNSHGRTENRTRDLMVSSQRPWPLDHEAGHFQNSSSNISSTKEEHSLRASENIMRKKIFWAMKEKTGNWSKLYHQKKYDYSSVYIFSLIGSRRREKRGMY